MDFHNFIERLKKYQTEEADPNCPSTPFADFCLQQAKTIMFEAKRLNPTILFSNPQGERYSLIMEGEDKSRDMMLARATMWYCEADEYCFLAEVYAKAIDVKGDVKETSSAIDKLLSNVDSLSELPGVEEMLMISHVQRQAGQDKIRQYMYRIIRYRDDSFDLIPDERLQEAAQVVGEFVDLLPPVAVGKMPEDTKAGMSKLLTNHHRIRDTI